MSTGFFKKFMVPVILLAGFSTAMWADFYVIPINKKVEHVILVAKKGGDFTDVKAAMDSITDANETNRYLVYVGPGVYTVTETINLKPYVTLKGSGVNATLLKGAVSNDSLASSAIISGAWNAGILELTAFNTGGGTYSIGIYNNTQDPFIRNVTTIGAGGTNNYGIYNSSSAPIISNSGAYSYDGTVCYGIFNTSNSFPVIQDTEILANGGTDSNYGIYDSSSGSTINGVNIEVQGGSSSYAIYSTSSNPSINNVTAHAYNSTYNYGIYFDRSNATVTNVITSVYAGDSNSNNFGIYNTRNSDTQMTDVTVQAGGGAKSRGIYNDSSSPTMINVTATAKDAVSSLGILNISSSPKIFHSTISGETDDISGGTPICHYTVGIVGTTYKDLNTSCQ